MLRLLSVHSLWGLLVFVWLRSPVTRLLSFGSLARSSSLVFMSPPTRTAVGGGRHLFPLQPRSIAPSVDQKLSRKCRQRVSRRSHVIADFNECVSGLNHLSGVDASEKILPSQARELSQSYIFDQVTRCSPPADVEAPEAALRMQLGTHSSL